MNETKSQRGEWKIKTLEIPHSIKIRYGIYSREEEIEQYILFLNGHGEFIEKYDYLPDDLELPPHYAFLTWDHRGQGASGGEPRLHIENYEEMAKDAQFVVKTLVGNKPYKVIAHSMGGLIALYSTMKGYLAPERLIMSAPLFGIQHPIPEVVGKGLANLATQVGIGKWYFQKHLQSKIKFENNIFTHSLERFEKRFKSPYMIEGITFGWIKATFDAIDYVTDTKHLKSFKTPTKILYGDDERLVDINAIEEWVKKAKKVSSAKITCEKINKTRHEIFAEAPPAYTQVLDRTRNFVFSPS